MASWILGHHGLTGNLGAWLPALWRRHMRASVLLALLTTASCTFPRYQSDLRVGDVVPPELTNPGTEGIWLVARPEDCFGCRLEGAFVALRSVQRAGGSAESTRVRALLITPSPHDTLSFSGALTLERVQADIAIMSPRVGRRIFNSRKLPAIYFVQDGRITHEWKATSLARIVIGRHEIRDVVSFASKRAER